MAESEDFIERGLGWAQEITLAVASGDGAQARELSDRLTGCEQAWPVILGMALYGQKLAFCLALSELRPGSADADPSALGWLQWVGPQSLMELREELEDEN